MPNLQVLKPDTARCGSIRLFEGGSRGTERGQFTTHVDLSCNLHDLQTKNSPCSKKTVNLGRKRPGQEGVNVDRERLKASLFSTKAPPAEI